VFPLSPKFYNSFRQAPREAQGRSREAGSEGSVEQSCEMMNK
jgi:hypothetical protein